MGSLDKMHSATNNDIKITVPGVSEKLQQLTMKRFLQNLTKAKNNQDMIEHVETPIDEVQPGKTTEETDKQLYIPDMLAGTLLKSTTFKKGDFIKKVSDHKEGSLSLTFMKAADWDVNSNSGKNEEYYVLTFE